MNCDKPSISIVIPTLNCGAVLDKCLNSITSQDYDRQKLEIIVVDGGSEDSTAEVARRHNARFIVEKKLKENQEQRKSMGLLSATGDIVGFIDSDNILPHNRWLINMVKPFSLDSRIVATQPLRYAYTREVSALNRYFALMGVNDPVPYYLGKRDRLSWAEEDEWNLLGEASDCGDYFSVKFSPSGVPTLGANGFFVRRDVVLKAKSDRKNFLHIDINCDLINLGYDTYGIVKDDIIHLSGQRFLSFILKRYVYMKQYYLKNKHLRRYRMYTPADRRNLLKFIFFSITLVEPLTVSLRGYRKLPDRAWFLHPAVCLAILFAYGFAVLNWQCRRLIRGNIPQEQ